MALIVQKYGGTSVGSAELIRNVARRVAKWQRAGHDIVVVSSAMAGETNRLLALAAEIQAQPDPRELDVIAATGEQVSAGLVAMALAEEGVIDVRNGERLARALRGGGHGRHRLRQYGIEDRHRLNGKEDLGDIIKVMDKDAAALVHALAQ